MTTLWPFHTNHPTQLDDFITNPANELVDLVGEVLANHPNLIENSTRGSQLKTTDALKTYTSGWHQP